MSNYSPPPDDPPAVPSPPGGGGPAGTAPGEQVRLDNNRFGTVTNLAVRYNVKKGLLAAVHPEILTMRHVVAVRLDTTRHVAWGIILIIIGLLFLVRPVLIIITLILAAIGVLLVWGHPTVVVTAADGQPRPSASWPWTRPEAEEFVKAVSHELMARG